MAREQLAHERRIVRLCGAAALAVTLVYTIAGAIIRPAMFSDSAWGFLGWDHRAGLPFNYVTSTNPANIATDAVSFASWWSPGQHLVPGLLECATSRSPFETPRRVRLTVTQDRGGRQASPLHPRCRR
jgi:hypothetical protein